MYLSNMQAESIVEIGCFASPTQTFSPLQPPTHKTQKIAVHRKVIITPHAFKTVRNSFSFVFDTD